MIKEFLESDSTAKEFIEDAVTSASISSVTDAPGRREVPYKPEEDPTLVQIDKT